MPQRFLPKQRRETNAWIRPLFLIAVLAGPWLWLFGWPIVANRSFAYRDAAHYYFPLLQTVAEEWRHGRVPLWNDRENLGQPLAADATAGAFYPMAWLLCTPLPYPLAYKLYIGFHIALAAYAMFFASTSKCSRSAARPSDLPKPSVPSTANFPGTHWRIMSGHERM